MLEHRISTVTLWSASRYGQTDVSLDKRQHVTLKGCCHVAAKSQGSHCQDWFHQLQIRSHDNCWVSPTSGRSSTKIGTNTVQMVYYHDKWYHIPNIYLLHVKHSFQPLGYRTWRYFSSSLALNCRIALSFNSTELLTSLSSSTNCMAFFLCGWIAVDLWYEPRSPLPQDSGNARVSVGILVTHRDLGLAMAQRTGLRGSKSTQIKIRNSNVQKTDLLQDSRL